MHEIESLYVLCSYQMCEVLLKVFAYAYLEKCVQVLLKLVSVHFSC